jgi:hypothetical protein
MFALGTGLIPGTQEANAIPVEHGSCGGGGLREAISEDAHEICHALCTRNPAGADLAVAFTAMVWKHAGGDMPSTTRLTTCDGTNPLFVGMR